MLDANHPRSRRVFDDDAVERMRYLYEEEGRSCSEIGQIMHCFKSTVRVYLSEAGVQMRPIGGSSPRLSHRDIETIKFLYWQCEWTAEQIAEYMGCHETTILTRMRRAGIPRRARSRSMKLAIKSGRHTWAKERRKAVPA